MLSFDSKVEGLMKNWKMWWLIVLMSVRTIWGAHGACEPIRIEMCRGLGYNVTAMPNLIGHEVQGDAEFTLQTFSPLIQYGCSAQLHLFLCSVYVPMCTEKVPSPIGPCRGLCEQVRARCYPVLQGFGFPWPAALNCSKFPPQNNHQHMCMEGPGEPGPAIPIQTIGAGNGPWGCSWYAKSGLYIFLNRSGRCAAACDADILWSQRDKKIAEAWTAAFATVCLFSVAIAIFTALKPRKQYGTTNTAEKAITCLAVCHAVVAVGYVIRLAAGRVAVACTQAIPLHSQDQVIIAQHQQQYLTQDGLDNPYCAIVFLMLYYFGGAASVWWVVICAWWCIVARKWTKSPDNCKENGFGLQHGFSTVGSVAAWGLPAAHTIAVLVTRDVDADELSGSCFVGQQSTRSLLVLVLAPQFVYLTLGSTFFLVGTAALLFPRPSVSPSQVLKTLQPNPLIRNQRDGAKSPAELYKRQKKLVIRIGAFICFYGLVMICLTCTIFYEWWGRDSWLRAPEPTKEPKVTSKPLLQVFILRIIVFLGAGVISAAWIWWPNAISVWRRFPPCKQPPHKCHPHAHAVPVPVVRCYSTGSTTPTPHQLHHLGRLSPPQHPLLHQHPIVINSQMPHRSHKKHRKHRKHHSGSETRV
ncbi:frizzled-4 [Leptopilina heterotoma]|uniref:frizzled-4 n=1 Tax=Leptopilina heterotoma TaxID=63436 RepID=UPI001CA97210|nr:frizzled-4 [Leptopilina heterotoma]